MIARFHNLCRGMLFETHTAQSSCPVCMLITACGHNSPHDFNCPTYEHATALFPLAFSVCALVHLPAKTSLLLWHFPSLHIHAALPVPFGRISQRIVKTFYAFFHSFLFFP